MIMSHSNHDTIDNNQIWLLVIAHPDDESMFFLPTIRNILKSPTSTFVSNSETQSSEQSRQAGVHILCLSNGDYREASDGPIRTREIQNACEIISSGEDGNKISVTVLNEEQMRDGPNEQWDKTLVANAILNHVKNILLSSMLENTNEQSWSFLEKSKYASCGEKNIKSIHLNLVTFDSGGVSHHPNHVDVFNGVRHILHQHVSLTQDQSNQTMIARLKLWNERETVEMTVKVLTLKTIYNPIYKYFFWAFEEIIPFFLLLIIQIMWWLLLYFLGGWIWKSLLSKSESQSMVSHLHPYSGRTITPDGHVQYRIMEPLLVWRAMATHRSQFVWYRRLSVIFSRYSYLNELIELPPDTSYITQQVDAMRLPSVTTIEENDSSPDFLLTTRHMNALRDSILPPSLFHRPWKRIYSLARDGDSFVCFQKLVGEWNSRDGGHSTILVVRTSEDELLGGYADSPYLETVSHPSGSSSRSCLFTIDRKVTNGRDFTVSIYGKNYGSVPKRIVFDATRRRIAFGGGRVGSKEDGFGLCLEDGFMRGSTGRCEAFDNEPLVKGKDVFDVLDVEVWGFVFGQM